MKQFTADELSAAADASRTIDFENVSTLVLYGKTEQDRINCHLDDFIHDMNAMEAGIAARLVSDIESGCRLMKLGQLKLRLRGVAPSWVERTFLGALDLPELVLHLADSRDAILELFDGVRRKAEDRQRTLLACDIRLKLLREQYESHIRTMAVRLAGGEMALLRGIEERERHREQSDLARNVGRFEERLLRLREAYDRALNVTMPLIEGVMRSGATEAAENIEAIHDTVLRLKDIVTRVSTLQETQLRRCTDVGRLAETIEALLSTVAQGTALEQRAATIRRKALSEMAAVKEMLA